MMDKCLFINLDTRQDRLAHVTRQLELIGVKGERFNACKHSVGAIGCAISHIKCLELARSRRWDSVFICEDDIVFKDPDSLLNSYENFMNSDIQWDVLIIGGNNFPPYEKLSDSYIKISKCQTTTGYIVKSHYYDTLLSNFKQSLKNLINHSKSIHKYAIDIHWMELQGQDNWYMLIPATVTQKADYSDIQKETTNYDMYMLDYSKKWLIDF